MCQKFYPGKTFSIYPNGFFFGVSGKYLFVSTVNAYKASLQRLSIYDSSTGKLTSELDFNENRKVVIEKFSNRISLTFYRPLNISCVPITKQKSCWNSILKDNHIGQSIKIANPDCSKALKIQKNAAKNPNLSLQITVKVRVDDITKQKITFLGGDSTCDATP